MRVVDFHCDTILKIAMSKEPAELKKNNFSIDIEKLKKANSLAQFFALFIFMKADRDPMELCLEMLDRFYIELEKNKDSIALARNYDEMMNNDKNGKMSAFLTIEEGGAIKGKLHNLRNFYRLGVRLITLTWNFQNEIGNPNCKEECRNMGLTQFGEEVVHEMNRLGMIIDVSHLSDAGFYDVARLSSKPFIASHSNARELCGHTRNLTDDMIRVLGSKGGVMGINFAGEFLGESEPGKIARSKICNMVKHIRYIVDLAGIDCVGLGSDFDGIYQDLELDHAGKMSELANALKENGFSNEDVEKIFYKNVLRVYKEILE
jgi:membrane dipeptidase